MEVHTLLEYWTNPFSFVQLGLGEDDVYSDSMPIVFMGGRGTGKTMFLRYWSYKVQRACLNEKFDGKFNFLDQSKGVGFYVRIKGAELRSFEGFGLGNEQWTAIFTHYFELNICREYLQFISSLITHQELTSDELHNEGFLKKCSKLLTGDENAIDSIVSALDYVQDEISYVTRFRSQIPLSDVQFEPNRIYTAQELSFGFPEIVKNTIEKIPEHFRFVIMIDEYENFLVGQQRVINSILKFVDSHITFRIGMRLEGFRTFDTVNADDFIKEGRDYRKIVFEEVLISSSGYKDYLKDIANKRLQGVNCFFENGFTDITNFLGVKENLEDEGKKIVNDNGDRIFKAYKIDEEKDKSLLRCEENPLLQVMNCLWHKRNRGTSEEINKAMTEFLTGKKTKGATKYKNDYTNKYKLSLVFVLCTIYKKKKSYYSFNTFAFLSSGIVGHFIELCRRSFQYAEFESKGKLLENGIITSQLQNNAARDLATSELQQSRRIEEHGNLLYMFTYNLGNIFRAYHKDIDIKYPETNQFYTDQTMLDDKIKEAFEAAQRWSLIQKKPNPQQKSIGEQQGDIFTLNRVFAPIFGTSYRTRGGYSVGFTKDEIELLMTETDKVAPKIHKSKNSDSDKSEENGQQELDF